MAKKKKHHSSMRQWPGGTQTVHPGLLLYPLKKIMHDGYKLERRSDITNFDYCGYNIGEPELQLAPSPEERFSSHWIEASNKFQQTLLDNVLMIALQLGIEQGRRLERKNKLSQEIMDAVLAARTNRIKILKETLSKYDPSFKETEQDILLPSNEEGLLIDPEFEMSENVDP